MGKLTKITLRSAFIWLCLCPSLIAAAPTIDLQWKVPEVSWFYVETIVQTSVPGSYFAACSWKGGYCGIQEMPNGARIIIFSVWDNLQTTQGDTTPRDQRVECLYNTPGSRVERFWWEGTGGMCRARFNWVVGQRIRILINARNTGTQTVYSGFIFLNNKWQPIAIFRTKLHTNLLTNVHSFVEDFGGNGLTRSTLYGNTWAKGTNDKWIEVTKAKFMVRRRKDIKHGIHIGITDNFFKLTAGGNITNPIDNQALERMASRNTEPPIDVVRFTTTWENYNGQANRTKDPGNRTGHSESQNRSGKSSR